MDSFFGIGPFELVFIVIFALIFLGPERLPSAMREIIGVLRKARELTTEVTDMVSNEFGDLNELSNELRELDPRNQVQKAFQSPPKKKSATNATKKKESAAKADTAKPESKIAENGTQQSAEEQAVAEEGGEQGNRSNGQATVAATNGDSAGDSTGNSESDSVDDDSKPLKSSGSSTAAIAAAWTGKPAINRTPSPNAVASGTIANNASSGQTPSQAAAAEMDGADSETDPTPSIAPPHLQKKNAEAKNSADIPTETSTETSTDSGADVVSKETNTQGSDESVSQSSSDDQKDKEL